MRKKITQIATRALILGSLVISCYSFYQSHNLSKTVSYQQDKISSYETTLESYDDTLVSLQKELLIEDGTSLNAAVSIIKNELSTVTQENSVLKGEVEELKKELR